MTMISPEILIVNLKTQLPESTQQYSVSILENEIKRIHMDEEKILAYNNRRPHTTMQQNG